MLLLLTYKGMRLSTSSRTVAQRHFKSEPSRGVGSRIRVTISSSDGINTWHTVGSSTNVIEASYLALADSLEYALVHDRYKQPETIEQPAQEIAV